MAQNHTLRIQPQLAALSRAQIELSQRLSKLIHHLHLFLPSVRSTSIRPDEEVLRSKLEAIEAELRRPGGLGRVGGRVGELWGLVGRVRAQREASSGKFGNGDSGWAVVDGSAFEEIKQVGFWIALFSFELSNLTTHWLTDRFDLSLMHARFYSTNNKGSSTSPRYCGRRYMMLTSFDLVWENWTCQGLDLDSVYGWLGTYS